MNTNTASAYPTPLSFLNGKKAVLLNFTADSYHWGCYGTSMEIYHTLLDQGYYVETVSVQITHKIQPVPTTFKNFDDSAFFKDFYEKNRAVCTSLSNADLVVVNGEGTLHRLNNGPRNLLYLIYICKKYFKKPVHLINFSCFPNGDTTLPSKGTMIYPRVLRFVDKVVPREHSSHTIFQNSEVKSSLGFDCLPRFLNRYALTNTHAPEGHVLISGGVNFNEKRFGFYVELIEYLLNQNIPVKFLSGAKTAPAMEDLVLQKRFKENASTKDISIVQAKTMTEWVHEFQTASFLFSARFHHTIAALSVGTPFSFLQSNTPKITSILETLKEDVKEVEISDAGLQDLKNTIHSTLSEKTTNVSERRVSEMLRLAAENFA